MGMVLPTVLLLIFMALIGWGLILFLNRLERMSSGNAGGQKQAEQQASSPKQRS